VGFGVKIMKRNKTYQTGYCIFSIQIYNINIHIVVGGLFTLLQYTDDIEAALRAVDDLLTAFLLSRQLWIAYRWNKKILLLEFHV
jgi:hypothetical protein